MRLPVVRRRYLHIPGVVKHGRNAVPDGIFAGLQHNIRSAGKRYIPACVRHARRKRNRLSGLEHHLIRHKRCARQYTGFALWTLRALRTGFTLRALRTGFSLRALRTWFALRPLWAGFTLRSLWPWLALRALRTWFALRSLWTGLALRPLRTWLALRALRAGFTLRALRTGFPLRALRTGLARTAARVAARLYGLLKRRARRAEMRKQPLQRHPIFHGCHLLYPIVCA